VSNVAVTQSLGGVDEARALGGVEGLADSEASGAPDWAVQMPDGPEASPPSSCHTTTPDTASATSAIHQVRLHNIEATLVPIRSAGPASTLRPVCKHGHVAFRIKRIYDEPEPGDGFRVLVDRLWPRGVSKERARLDLWLKDVAPSTELRTWYHAHSGSFDEFAERYRAEVRTNPAVDELRGLAATHDTVTLLYGVRDPEHNHARVLADCI
jgi:uncharacterized protein YeaO (DUF488 family)